MIIVHATGKFLCKLSVSNVSCSLKLISFNVNGIRAVIKKGFLSWFTDLKPDILCLQETKAQEEQVPQEIRNLSEYFQYYHSAEKKGYSGVATLSRIKPDKVQYGLGNGRFDSEGRALVTDYGDFILFNVYFPNGKASSERLDYKMDFYEEILLILRDLLHKGRKIIVCGDVNTAHREIDLAR
ncbi:MAG: exodeoxyribonuclease III, partial [Spirochaetae bacterium HGW-Spirochaetae-6]